MLAILAHRRRFGCSGEGDWACLGGSDDDDKGDSSIDLPAFFSWAVSSAQLPFMRSRRAIHRSACSWTGMPSHLFSMLASVGFEMAWVEAAR